MEESPNIDINIQEENISQEKKEDEQQNKYLLEKDIEEGWEDISEDGLVLKKILKAAPADAEQVPACCEVIVDYVGRVEATNKIFDKTKEDDPFVFRLGKPGIIMGWEVAIPKMKKGETSLIKIAPEYAYGKRGFGDSIPPNATLLFKVTLLGWNEGQNVTNDGSIYKIRVLERGVDYVKPQTPLWVKINYSIKKEKKIDNEDDNNNEEGNNNNNNIDDEEIIESREDFKFVIGEEVVSHSLELMLGSMLNKEKSLFRLKAKEYNFMDPLVTKKYGINEEDNLIMTVEILDMDPERPYWELSSTDQIGAAKKRKEEGNQLFRDGKYRVAITRYNKAKEYISSDADYNNQEKQQAKEIETSIYLNIAACEIKRESWKEVIQTTDKVLNENPLHAKALYRKSQALISLGDWEEAEGLLEQAKILQPNDKNIIKLSNKLQKMIKRNENKQKQIYKNLFN